MVHPSYRLIDLGRVETWPMREAKEKAKYKEKEGKELEYVELPLDAEGYLDWYMPQEGLKKVWYSIKSDWSQDQFAELTEAKKLLLISNTPEAYFHGMYIAVRGKSAFSHVPEREEKGASLNLTFFNVTSHLEWPLFFQPKPPPSTTQWLTMTESKDLEKRRRYIYMDWPRHKDGGYLPQPPPAGKRPPNGLIWASSVEGFFRIQRSPLKDNWLTAWSISMIKDFDEGDVAEIADFLSLEPEPDPTILLPFPWLRLPVSPGSNPEGGSEKRPSWRSIQGSNREGGVIRQLDGFDPSKPIQFGSVYNHKLEEFIPASYFPDTLIVNDPKRITEGRRVEDGDSATVQAIPLTYKRVWPIISDEIKRHENTAYLNMADAPHLGVGHHSSVHRASLKLPRDLEAYTGDGSIGVAAKVAFRSTGARELLENEGRVYNGVYGKATDSGMDCIDADGLPRMPSYRDEEGKKNQRHLMEDWQGLCLLTPEIQFPTPVKAVLPKFYGYYIPTKETERAAKKRQEAENGKGRYWRGEGDLANTVLSPILLLEDCGEPIEPTKMNIDDRTECLSFIHRLGFADMAHNSVYTRNILVQPGPLDRPPPLRSLDTPSYRIIDLGRSETWDMRLERECHGQDLTNLRLPKGRDGFVEEGVQLEGPMADLAKINRNWSWHCRQERDKARKELELEVND
ncbi:hypothetical protein ONZ45_g16179 [Pleurotus djamor]|nr:hypothetical protein ONZ45_g16179 [Pleurotus djamor]